MHLKRERRLLQTVLSILIKEQLLDSVLKHASSSSYSTVTFVFSYQSATYPDYVNYVQFSDDIESIFTTKNLEKMPLQQVRQFQPPVEWEQNHLSPQMEGTLTTCVERLAEKVIIVLFIFHFE